MSTTITKLWNGQIEPAQTVGRHNEELECLERLTARNDENLERLLAEDAKELFEKYRDCVSEHEMFSNEQAFRAGFCLGVRLTAEAMLP